VIEPRSVKFQFPFAFAYAGPMFDMPSMMMLGEMAGREGEGVEQSLQHAI
jgi:hypothetical protein